MKKFESKPFKNYLSSHTKLNNYIKISTVAVDYLYNSKENNEELSALLNDLILKSGERWTSRNIKKPKEELSELKNDLTKSAIIWVYSAFDVFFKKVEGMLSENFNKKDEKKTEEGEEENKQHKIIELYQKLNWSTNQIDGLLPILGFYESLRHSVAHNVGIPSGKLYSLSESEKFKESISNWETKFPKRKISPPPIIKEKIIELKPHHSIMYSETCLRISKDINNKILETLGVKYFIEKTVKKHLINKEELSKPNCSNYQRYIVFHLNNDYKISIKKYNEIYDDDEKLKLDNKRYDTMKNICQQRKVK